VGNELWRLVFVNIGVKITIAGSDVLEDLKECERGGLKILVCGTCLDHFNLLDRKQVGETTNMGARNRIRAKVKSVKKGDVMSLVKFDVTIPHEMSSVLTTESVEDL
jgi:hypothetical protein